MNLESVTAELRPRGPWEAMDLGARMVRRDAGVIYRSWFIVTLPLLVLASLGMLYLPTPGWVLLAYWWLEPLTDGPILHVISQRLFGGDADTRSALRSVPGHARRNIPFLLTPLRFHFARSLAVPVTQLEGLSGQKRRARAKVLNNVALNHGIGLTTAYQHLMLCLYLGVILFGYLLVPLSPMARAALRPGTNLISVHCHYGKANPVVCKALVDLQFPSKIGLDGYMKVAAIFFQSGYFPHGFDDSGKHSTWKLSNFGLSVR